MPFKADLAVPSPEASEAAAAFEGFRAWGLGFRVSGEGFSQLRDVKVPVRSLILGAER